MSLEERMKKYSASCEELGCEFYHKSGCKMLLPFPIGKFKKSEMPFDHIWGLYWGMSINHMQRIADKNNLPKIVPGDNEPSIDVFIQFFESLPEIFEIW